MLDIKVQNVMDLFSTVLTRTDLELFWLHLYVVVVTAMPFCIWECYNIPSFRSRETDAVTYVSVLGIVVIAGTVTCSVSSSQ